jgi:vancomycin resistance protein YoaR
MWYHIETPALTTQWSEVKRKLRNRFADLTEADLNYPETELDDMLSNMQVKLSKTKIQLRAVIATD